MNERRPGRNKLVYDKTAHTIVAVPTIESDMEKADEGRGFYSDAQSVRRHSWRLSIRRQIWRIRG